MSFASLPIARTDGAHARTAGEPWLFGRRLDLWAFGGSALLSLALLSIGAPLGLLHADTPLLLWLLLVVMVDVAHVWTTLFRVYLDARELRRRPLLYLGVPGVCYLVLCALHGVSAGLFWRVLAYVAVFHFVRQQVGWLALYGSRPPAPASLDRGLDRLTLYASMLYPLLYWHAQLPRAFHWFRADDFVPGLPLALVRAITPAYWALLSGYTLRQMHLWRSGRLHPGRLLLIATTWACWHLGIVTFNSDYAFTVTNVIIHGVPYAVLVYLYGRRRARRAPRTVAARILALGVWAFIAVSVMLALLEESGWDFLVWHAHSDAGPHLSPTALAWLVPLLALPQATHYVLDGFIWRRRADADLSAWTATAAEDDYGTRVS